MQEEGDRWAGHSYNHRLSNKAGNVYYTQTASSTACTVEAHTHPSIADWLIPPALEHTYTEIASICT